MNNKDRVLYMSHIMLKEIDHVRTSSKYTDEQKQEMHTYREYLRDIENNNFVFLHPPEFFNISLDFDQRMKVYDLICDIECGRVKITRIKK